MIHDPVSEVVRDINCNLGMPLKARPKHRVSSAARDAMDYEESDEESVEPSAWCHGERI